MGYVFGVDLDDDCHLTPTGVANLRAEYAEMEMGALADLITSLETVGGYWPTREQEIDIACQVFAEREAAMLARIPVISGAALDAQLARLGLE